MAKFKVCSECGVPRRIIKENLWLSNGRIVERKNRSHSMLFFENDNILGVFENIEKILGVSIGRIIEASERKQAYDYIDHFIPSLAKKTVRKLPFDPMSAKITSQAQLMGYGDIEVLGKSLKHDGHDYYKLGVRNVWFLDAFTGIVAGSLEALMGVKFSVTREEVSPGYYEFLASALTVPPVLEDRLPMPVYPDKPGETGLPHCRTCGGPERLSDYQWRMDDGVIAGRTTGARMILVGPAEFEAIFSELEYELGQDITQVIIEAQRRFAKGGHMAVEDPADMKKLRRQMALRGLGNLVEMGWSGGGMRLRLENPCLVLLLVGMAQGLYELSTGRDGVVEWSVAEDGDLTIEIQPV